MNVNKDGVELRGLGQCTLKDVFNDPSGLRNVQEDDEYYYVFPDYKPGYCGDELWMVNKRNKEVSHTDLRDLCFNDVLDKLKDIHFEEFRKRVS